MDKQRDGRRDSAEASSATMELFS